MDNEKSKEEMVKEAVEEAKKVANTDTEKEEPEENKEEMKADASQEKDKKDVSEEHVKEDKEADEEVESGKKEKRFKKKKPDKKEEKIAELTDKVTRQMAEFDNFRKRTEKEKSQMYEIGVKDVIEKMLPVVDSFERGLEAVTEEEKETPFAQGMDKIYKQMMSVLEDIGVKPIEAAGQEFDPELHNAVMHVEDEAFGDNIVAEELQKGYIYRDSVVRHSMVKVAN